MAATGEEALNVPKFQRLRPRRESHQEMRNVNSAIDVVRDVPTALHMRQETRASSQGLSSRLVTDMVDDVRLINVVCVQHLLNQVDILRNH